jgi:PAS domain S-box-containing protein
LHLTNPLAWGDTGPGWWYPPAGLGLALIAWFGPRAALWIALDGLLVVAQIALWRLLGPNRVAGFEPVLAGADALLGAGMLQASWWLYHQRAHGARGLDDSRSAMLFLFLVPGIGAGLWSVLHSTLAFLIAHEPLVTWWTDLATFWMSRALGMLVLTPLLLTGLTWLLSRQGLLRPEDTDGPRKGPLEVIGGGERLAWGDGLELLGLAIGAGILTWLAVHSGRNQTVSWQPWGGPLLLIVWAGLRQGLRGSSLVFAASVCGPLLFSRGEPLGSLFTLLVQGNLLSQGAVALLVAAISTGVRANENRYRQIMAHVPVVIYSARFRKSSGPAHSARDLDAEVTLVSAASESLLGHPPRRLLGDYAHWLECVHPDDREVVRAAVAQVGRQHQPVTCEYRLAEIRDRGSWIMDGEDNDPRSPRVRWVRDTLAPHLDAGGRLIGWEGVLTDITEQRVLADDLRRTTSMLHALVGNLPAGVFFVQAPLGHPILVNARARQLLGRREDMAAGLDHLVEVYRLHRPDGSPYPVEELPVVLALRKGVTSMRDDIVVHRPDGRRTPLVVWAAPVALARGPAASYGQPEAAVWVLEDLTSLHQAEAARRDTEERYRDLVESLPMMLIQADREMHITYANRATRDITGYDLTEIADPQAWASICHPDDMPMILEMALAGQEGRGSRAEFRYRAKDGTEKVGLAITEPRRRPDGGIVGTTTLIVDVTRERQLEQDLMRAQRLELVGRLASGIAHDFNNLLSVVLSLTELVGSSLPGQHAVHEDLARIRDATEQASNLASQLLAFSKQRRITARRIEVNRVARRTLELLRSTLPPRIELKADLAGHDLFIQADETQMQQVLMNLCLNGRDAMPGGGQLNIQTALVPTKGDWVRLSVQDTGIGMTAQTKAHLFDPFFSTKDRGTGLGLTVVQQIVESQGGRVEVTSEPGHGARFDVWWPAACSEDAEGHEG